MPETLIAIVALLERRCGLRRRRDRGDRRRAVPAGDAGDGPGRPLRLPLPRQARPGAAARRRTGRRWSATSLFFLAFFALAGLLAWGPPAPVRIPVGDRLPRRLRLLHPPHPARRRRGAGGGDARPADLRAPRRAPRRPGPGALRHPARWSGSGRWSAAPTSSSRSCSTIAEQHRRRGARPVPDPGAAGDRAAGEGQQLLLGPRRQGRPRARQHHRRDGLPVDDPGRDRPDLHRLERSTRNAVLSIGLGLAGGLLAYESLHRAAPLQAARGDRLVRSSTPPHHRGRPGAEPGSRVGLASLPAVRAGESHRDPPRPELGERFEHQRRRASSAGPWGRPGRSCPRGRSTKVERSIPMYFLPYIDFSPQAPYSSATLWSGSAEQGEAELRASRRTSRSAAGSSGEIPEHPRARSRVLGAAVADAAGLGRAARGVGARIEVEDDRLALEVGELDLVRRPGRAG